MRTLILIFATVLILLMGCTPDQSEKIAQLKQEISDLKAVTGPPPSSLDSLYPPKAEAPVYLFKMIELSTPLEGIAADMFEEDLEHARTNFENFKIKYWDIAKLVPEWENAYLKEPVEALNVALEIGELEKVMAAIKNVGKVCHDCHIANMTKVQLKYHWPDFSDLIVTDPILNEDIDFSHFKHQVKMTFAGILVDIEQGQVENARSQFETFNKRFRKLRKTCFVCHETVRENYVDQSIQTMIEKVGTTLSTASPNAEQVGKLLQEIEMESCFKCHLIHIPAAYTKARWKRQGKNEGE